jgi:hypothetical protein
MAVRGLLCEIFVTFELETTQVHRLKTNVFAAVKYS